jgi:hypothetical protein
MDRMEDKEEVGKVGRECESVRQKMGTVKSFKLRQMIEW